MGVVYIFAKLSGQLDQTGWTQFYEFAPSDPSQHSKGELICLVSSGGAPSDYLTMARQVASSLHATYYKHAGKPYDALESAVRQTSKHFAESLSGLQLAALVIANDVLYMSAVGGASVLVFRQGKLVPILVSDESQSISASGTVSVGDVVLLLTSQAGEQFGSSLLVQALTDGQLSTALSQLAESLGFTLPTGNLGIGMVQLLASQKVEVPAPAFSQTNRFAKVRELVNLQHRKVQVRSDLVSQESVAAKKKTLLVGFVLLGLLIVSIGFGIYQKGRLAKQSTFDAQLASANHSYDEAVNLFSLNPARSRELFAQSQTAAEELVAAGFTSQELAQLLDKLAASKQSVLGEYDGNPQLFLDLKLVSTDFAASKLGATTDRVVILDDEHNKAISVGLAAKTTQTLAGPDDLDGVTDLVAWDSRNYAQTNAAFFDLGASDVVVPRQWSGPLPPIVYAGNLYALDTSEGAIWRFPGVPSGFGAKENWLAQGDVSDTISWAIDGSVWLLKSGGQIRSFLGGAPKDFVVSGVVDGTSGFTKIYTNDEVSDLYLLDPQNNRVVVMAKDGTYKAQYGLDTSEVVDFAVSEKQKILVMLTKDKLLSVELKHL